MVWGTIGSMLTDSYLVALLGGAIIGAGAAALLILSGRIAGVSGILGGALAPRAGEIGWRLMFLAGLYMYLRMTRPRGGRGRLSLWLFIVVLAAFYFMSLQPLPAGLSERAIGLMSMVMWLFLPWAWWIESTRRTVR